jgi:hypothetical protein
MERAKTASVPALQVNRDRRDAEVQRDTEAGRENGSVHIDSDHLALSRLVLARRQLSIGWIGLPATTT